VKLAEWERANGLRPDLSTADSTKVPCQSPRAVLPSGSIMVDVPSSSLAAMWLYGRDGARNRTMRAVICAKRRSDLPEKAS
jgi:hypothetical protein